MTHFALGLIQDDPLCPACGEKEEISFHFLGECCANMRLDILEHTSCNLRSCIDGTIYSFLWFARATKRFSWPLVTLELHIGPNCIYCLGAEWLTPTRSKDKGKSKGKRHGKYDRPKQSYCNYCINSWQLPWYWEIILTKIRKIDTFKKNAVFYKNFVNEFTVLCQSDCRQLAERKDSKLCQSDCRPACRA